MLISPKLMASNNIQLTWQAGCKTLIVTDPARDAQITPASTTRVLLCCWHHFCPLPRSFFQKWATAMYQKARQLPTYTNREHPCRTPGARFFQRFPSRLTQDWLLTLRARRPGAQPGKRRSPCPPLCPRYLDSGQAHLSATTWAKRRDHTREEGRLSRAKC